MLTKNQTLSHLKLSKTPPSRSFKYRLMHNNNAELSLTQWHDLVSYRFLNNTQALQKSKTHELKPKGYGSLLTPFYDSEETTELTTLNIGSNTVFEDYHQQQPPINVVQLNLCPFH